MATVIWRGLQGITQAQRPYTCNAPAAGETMTLIHNKKKVTHTGVTGDTGTTAAAGLVAAWQASNDGEWAELTVSSSGAVVTVLGPADGAPFTLTTAVTGAATLTAGTPVAAISPNDPADAANYEGGALPGNNDTLRLPRDAADMRFNLTTALASITGLTILRELGGPNVNLPDYRAQGYREYRGTRLVTPATTVRIDLDGREEANAIRLDVGGATCALTVTGAQGGQLDGEAVEVTGMASTSSVRVANGSVAVAGGVVPTIAGDGSAVRIESGATLTAIELRGCSSRVGSSWSGNLDVLGGTCDVVGTATGTCTVVGGTVAWKGSGNLNAPQIGAGGTVTTDGGSAPLALTGTIAKLDATAGFRDPFTRLARPYAIASTYAGMDGLELGRTFTLTVT